MVDSAKINFSFDDDGKAARLFARLQDPEPALRDFGEYKRRRIVLLMKPLPSGRASEPSSSHCVCGTSVHSRPSPSTSKPIA